MYQLKICILDKNPPILLHFEMVTLLDKGIDYYLRPRQSHPTFILYS